MEKWESASVSIAGRRASNEDAVLVLSPTEGGMFLAVADGMGGITGGKVASGIALETAKEYLQERFASPVSPSELKQILRELYARADAALKKEQGARPHLAGMGTTLACVLAVGRKFVVANIGDSRVFHLSSGRFDQLTVDHTYIQDMITRTGVKPDPALLRQFGHVLTRSLQGNGDGPDIFPKRRKWFTLSEGDGFLLCSDGLILDKSADREPALERQLREAHALRECAEGMAASAVGAGSGDNISVIVARWDRSPEGAGEGNETGTSAAASESAGGVNGKISRRTLCLTFALFVLAAVAIAFSLHACGSAADEPPASANHWRVL